MEVLCESASKRAVRSLWDDRLAPFPELQAGDALALSVGDVSRISFPFDARLFDPSDLTDITFRAALGAGFLIPVDGTFPLTLTAADASTQTTDEISYDPSNWEVSDALNALSKVVAIGGVTVEGGDGFFRVTFNNVGVRNLLSGDAGSLVPTSIIDVQRVVSGDVDTREVQTVRIVQSAAAFATLSAASAAASIAMDTVLVGGGGNNHQVRITLVGNIYLGTWLFSKSGTQSAPIAYDDTAAQIEAALADVVGLGNVMVYQEANGRFLVTFLGALANMDLTGLVAVDGTNLVAIPEKSGVLDLGTSAISMLLNGSESRVVALEIEKVVGSNAPQKVLRRDVTLRRPVIEPVMTSPPPVPEIFGEAVVLRGYSSMNGGGAATDVSSIDITNFAVGSGPYFLRLGTTGEMVALYIDAGAANLADPAECPSVHTNSKHWTQTL